MSTFLDSVLLVKADKFPRYRRGKPTSNDVDIVISHSDSKSGKGIIPGLCKRLTARLYQKGLHFNIFYQQDKLLHLSPGLVTHVMRSCSVCFVFISPASLTCPADLSGFHSYNALRTEHWDSLEKALTVFKLPAKEGVQRVHRRLDLIFALPDSYWTAVIGW